MMDKLDLREVFDQLAKTQEKLRFINVYKGIPVSYLGQVMRVIDAGIVVQTNENQLVCMERDEETFLQSKHFPRVLHAVAREIDFSRKLVLLSNLEAYSYDIGKRKQVRVEPCPPIQVVVQHQHNRGGAIAGEISDLSMEGMAVFIFEPDVVTQMAFVPGESVQVYLSIPDMEGHTRELILFGEIENVRMQAYYQRLRLGIRLFDIEREVRPLLAHIIAERRASIAEEMIMIARRYSTHEEKS